ncbi:MAG: Bug family tripartite tricarboxylate transporter substrate binding protein [Alphaproteobacteria bacterium]
MTRTLLRCAAAILGFWAMGAQAQTAYPDRPIRLVIPYAPGGGTDATIRVLAGPMGEMLGQSIVIENRTGGAGTIGAAIVAPPAPAQDLQAFIARARAERLAWASAGIGTASHLSGFLFV